MKINKIIIAIAMLITILILTSACTHTPTGQVIQENNNKIKIGIMTKTTGELAYLGTNIVKSAELSIQELGLENEVELIIEDVGVIGGGAQAISAYNKLVQQDNVKIIIDGMLSDGTLAITPLLKKDKVVMITPLTGGENIDLASPYLFRNGPSDIKAGTLPAKQIYENFNYKKVALFTDNAAYTTDIAKHFRKEYKGEIIVDELIEAQKTDYRAELTKLQGKDIDAILLLDATGNSGNYIMKQLYELNIKKPIFTNFMAYNIDTKEVAGIASEDVYVYTPEFDEESAITKEFLKKYKDKYNHEPTIPFHTTGTYDAIKMSIQAINKVGYNGENIRKYLLNNIQDWKGMNGIVSFDEKGNTDTGFTLKQIHNEKLFPIKLQ